ncbi:MAG: hypothetical protein K1X88_31255 [Nannocystaceae bacterium]|nr:hypothetical protein [Nannocystaceae bacterium]
MLAALLCITLAGPPAAAAPAEPPPPRLSGNQAWSSWTRGHGHGGSTAPGAWQRLSLLGPLPRGGGLWLLGTTRAAATTSLDPLTRATTFAIAEVGSALGLELRAGWPLLFAGVLGQVAGAGAGSGRRAGAAFVTGVIWTLPSLPRLLDRRPAR